MVMEPRRAKLADGSVGFVVPVNHIPAAYWRRYGLAQSVGYWPDGLAKISERGVQDLLPATLRAATTGGGFDAYLVTKPEYKDTYYAWIPVEFFEPEVNEYGPISL